MRTRWRAGEGDPGRRAAGLKLLSGLRDAEGAEQSPRGLVQEEKGPEADLPPKSATPVGRPLSNCVGDTSHRHGSDDWGALKGK